MGLNGAERQARHRAKRASETDRLKARIAALEAKQPKRTAAEESARNAALLRQIRKLQAEIERQHVRPPRSESARNANLLKRIDAMERENRNLMREIVDLKRTYRQYLKDREQMGVLLGSRGRRKALVLPKKVQTGILKCLHPDTGPHVDAVTRNALTVEFLAIYPRRGA
jgi:HK97 family phage major capsid protein